MQYQEGARRQEELATELRTWEHIGRLRRETPSVPNSQLSRNTSCETIIHHPSLLNLTENIIRAAFCRLTESQVCGVPLFSLLTKTQFPRDQSVLMGLAIFGVNWLSKRARRRVSGLCKLPSYFRFCCRSRRNGLTSNVIRAAAAPHCRSRLQNLVDCVCKVVSTI
jgi:hypothetical protein